MPETPKSFEGWWAKRKKCLLSASATELIHFEAAARESWNAAIASLPPQAAAVPARQDAVPDKEKCDICGATLEFPADDDPMFEGDTLVTSKCRHVIRTHPSTQPPQAAVGEGELPLTITVEDRIHAHDDLLVAESDPDIDVRAWTKELRAALYARNRQLREAIAQRDEAREAIRKREQTIRAMSSRAIPAALDAPKFESEEIERLNKIVIALFPHISNFDMYGNKLLVEAQHILSHLRSLPSEPGSGVQRKAVEND